MIIKKYYLQRNVVLKSVEKSVALSQFHFNRLKKWHIIQHFTSTLVVMLHLSRGHGATLTHCSPEICHRPTAQARNKHWFYVTSLSKCWWNAVYTYNKSFKLIYYTLTIIMHEHVAVDIELHSAYNMWNKKTVAIIMSSDIDEGLNSFFIDVDY